MKRAIVYLAISLIIVTGLQAATISGKVTSQMQKEPLEGALVVLLKKNDADFSRTTVSDIYGNFSLSGISSGVYTLEAYKEHYYKNVLFDLEIQQGRHYDVDIRLLKCKPGTRRRRGQKEDSDYCFMIGGIEVQSRGAEIIPEEAVTTRKINSGEIEHMQATNLGDILALVPGVEKSQNPGLAKDSRVGLRSVSISGTAGGLETFGSTIIVDGNEVTNDANAMHRGFSGESGIDLRTIPADNIESVEVITGIPSAEYGNFSNGLIKVNTKSGYIASKFKAKLNPDTKTTSFSNGHRLGRYVLDYHLNYGYSERNLRKEGDEYHRFYGKATLQRKFLDNKLDTRLRGSYTRMLDNEKPTDIYQMKTSNQGFLSNGNFSFTYQKTEQRKLEGFLGFDLNRKKYYRQRWVTDQVVLTDTTVYYNGHTYTDTILAGYTGKLKEIGHEWGYRARLRHQNERQFNATRHRFIIGLEGNRKRNTGQGRVIHPFFNYYGFYSSRRSYSFDEYPDLQQWAAYFEDNIRGQLGGHRYDLMLGFRYDVFNPQGLNLDNMFAEKALLKSRHGDFLSPRFNFRFFLSDDLRLRVGAGKSAKAVSLAYIYKDPDYFEYLKDSVVVEEMHLQANPDLQAYSDMKYEASIDWRIKDFIGFSLTGYYSGSDDRPSSVTYPWGYDVNPDTITSASYAIHENRGWKKSHGVEFTLRTERFYNIQLKANATYRFSKLGRSGSIYDSSPDTSWENIWYQPSKTWREKVILDYQINYVSQRLGAWVTLDIQHIPLEHKKEVYRSNSTIKAIEELDREERRWYQGMVYWYDNEFYNYSSHWLFNFRVTKSLSQKTELSIYINNIFDDRGIWKSPFTDRLSERNPEIYYGLEVSTQW